MKTSFPRFAGLLSAACLLAAAGCSNSQTADSNSDNAGETAANDSASTPAAPAVGAAETGGGAPAASPSTPDGAVKEFFAAVKDNKLDRVWNLLPASYQNDVNSVVREFGKGVDAEMWDGVFKTANRYFSVTLAKQDMILQTPQAQQQLRTMAAPLAMMGSPIDVSNPAKLKQYSQPVYEAIIALLGSQLKTATELQSFDGGKFMGGPMSVFLSKMRQLMDAALEDVKKNPQFAQNPMMSANSAKMDINTLLSEVKISVQSSQGENATVSIVAGGFPQQLEMTKVEGKWIPAAMASNWAQMIAFLKGGTALVTAKINSAKPQIMPQLAKFDPLLAEAQNAKTQEEFNAAYAKLENAIMSPIAQATGMQGLATGGGGGGGVSPVTVIVPGRLDGKATRDIIKALEAASDNPQEAITLVESSGSDVTFRLSPVGNLEVFKTKLTFGEVTESDPLKKEIRLKVIGDPSSASAAVPQSASETPTGAAPVEPEPLIQGKK